MAHASQVFVDDPAQATFFLVPYLVKLAGSDAKLIYAPKDDEACVRARNRPPPRPHPPPATAAPPSPKASAKPGSRARRRARQRDRGAESAAAVPGSELSSAGVTTRR